MADVRILRMNSLSPPSAYEVGLRNGRREVLYLLRSDECYNEVANAKTTWWTAIEEACAWAEGKLNEGR